MLRSVTCAGQLLICAFFGNSLPDQIVRSARLVDIEHMAKTPQTVTDNAVAV